MPNEEDTFRFRYFGLFYVAPAQNSFMLRCRIPAGELTAAQMRGLAEIADAFGNGKAAITTRSNLQIREIAPKDLVNVITKLQGLGLTAKGAGVDNVRNITASPTAGIDPQELLDTRPFAHALHHYILNHRDLYGLPRKFNVAFEGGGAVDTVADTNDLGFMAVRVPLTPSLTNGGEGARSAGEGVTTAFHGHSTKDNPPVELAPGVYFRVELAGITGHKQLASDSGVLVKPGEAVAVAVAMIRVFIEHGDRTDRKKARLKYLIDKWGVEKFLDETQKKLAFPLVKFPLDQCQPRGRAGAVVKDQRLQAQLVARERMAVGPGMRRGEDEHQLIAKDRADLEAQRVLWLHPQRHVHRVGPQQLQHLGNVAGPDLEFEPRVKLLQFVDHGGQEMLAGRGGGAEAQARQAPFAEAFERLRRRVQLGQRAIHLREQLFAGLVEQHPLAGAFEEPTAQLGFQRLEAVTDRRGRQVEFCGGGHQAAAAGNRAENFQLSGFHRVAGRVSRAAPDFMPKVPWNGTAGKPRFPENRGAVPDQLPPWGFLPGIRFRPLGIPSPGSSISSDARASRPAAPALRGGHEVCSKRSSARLGNTALERVGKNS